MIAFRVDANKNVASGHLMRCLTIAKELKKKNTMSIFIMSDDEYAYLPSKYDFEMYVLNSDYNDWDGSVEELRIVIDKKKISLLFVDSYIVTPSFFEGLSNKVKLVYLDDNFYYRMNVDAVFAPTQAKEPKLLYDLYSESKTNLFVGKDYLIIRDEFKNISPSLNMNIPRVVITTGASDPYHLTRELVKRLKSDDRNYVAYVVLGMMNEDSEVIKKEIVSDTRFVVCENIDYMGKLFEKCNCAITAGGNTLYELLSCRIPSLCVAFSDDQEAVGKRLESLDVISYAGDIRKNLDINEIYNRYKELIDNKALRETFIKNCRTFTDGKGATRIAEELISMDRDDK